MTEEQAVLATLQEYSDAYCSKDTDRLMRLFDDGDDISLIGTGADELCSGRAEVRAIFERNFAEAKAENFVFGWRHVTVTGEFALIATTVDIHLEFEGEKMVVPVRWTVGMIKRTDGWRWLHRNASAAAGSQEEGEAYPDGK